MKYCPQCATLLVPAHRHDRVRPGCPACGFVYYHNPLPIAACVVEAAAGGLYLIRRRFAPGQGRWALPAGFIEHGEMPPAAAARETAEETGLLVQIGALGGVYGYIEAGGERSGLVIAYEAVVIGGRAEAGDDAIEVRRFDRAALPFDALAFETHRAAVRDWLARRVGR